jgi:hypothetical protein
VSLALSDGHDPGVCSCCLGDFANVPGIGRYYRVAAADRTFHDRDVNHIVVAGLSRQGSDAPSELLTHRLYFAHPQQPGKVCLARPATPDLREDRRGDEGNNFLVQISRVD